MRLGVGDVEGDGPGRIGFHAFVEDGHDFVVLPDAIYLMCRS